MERLTTDTPKDNLEMALNLFYIKDHEVWVRGYGPSPEYADVSLFNLTRDIIKTHIPDVELPADNDALSNMMPEWLMDGIDSAEGIVALLYTAAWAYAELRHKLIRYEDTGLEPEDLKKAFNETAILKLAEQALSTTPDHLRDLLQAEKDGRLVVLPCKVGATVYGHSKAEVFEYKVAVISLATYNWYLRCQNHNSDFWATDADIGKTVFLTREEAEAALAQDGGKDHA